MYLKVPYCLTYVINDLCWSIKHSTYFLFADDIKIFRTVKSATDCTLLESDDDSIRDWCAANCTKINIDKIGVIIFKRKIISINDDYKLYDKCMIPTDST